MHRSAYRGAVEYLWVIELEQAESRRVAVFWSLFGVLEVKDGLDRTGKKNR
jgi:hypothetical protein